APWSRSSSWRSTSSRAASDARALTRAKRAALWPPFSFRGLEGSEELNRVDVERDLEAAARARLPGGAGRLEGGAQLLPGRAAHEDLVAPAVLDALDRGGLRGGHADARPLLGDGALEAVTEGARGVAHRAELGPADAEEREVARRREGARQAELGLGV